MDNPKKPDSADRSRINVDQEYEMAYWAKKWQVSREEIIRAIKTAGPMVKDVAKRLGRAA